MKLRLLILSTLLSVAGYSQSVKISDMPAATTLAGSEIAPIVQSGANKKATIGLIRGWSSIGTDGQLLRVNTGATALEFFTPSYMVYPGAGIALSTGSGWGTSITDNSANWNLAFLPLTSNIITGTEFDGTDFQPSTNNEQSFSIGVNGKGFKQISFYSGDDGYVMYGNGATNNNMSFGYDGLSGVFSPYNADFNFNNRFRLKSLAGYIFELNNSGLTTLTTNTLGLSIGGSLGSSGDVLTSNGTTASWAAPSGGNLTGAITSSGLATSLGSFTSNALGTAISDPVRTVTGTDAIVQADNGRTIYFNSAIPFNFTIDALTINTFTMFRNIGTATVSFVDGSGVTSTGATALLADEVGGIEYIASTTPIISVVGSGGGGGGTWGSITGTLSSQTDLQTELDTKISLSGTQALTANKTLNTGGFDFDISSVADGGMNGSWYLDDWRLYGYNSGSVFQINQGTSVSDGFFELRTNNYYNGFTAGYDGSKRGFGIYTGTAGSNERLFIHENGHWLVNSSAGTSGQVLTSAGTGATPTWTTVSGGGLTVGTSTITSGTNTKVLYNNSGVLGEYTVSGTGNVALTTSPTFTTPALGTPSALVGTNITGTATGLTSGITNALKSATTTVNVSSATAPTSGQVLTATSGTAATWQTPAAATGAWLLASGGTATGTNTFAMGTNPFILTSGVTTGTGATAGIQNVFNSLTTGNGLDISSSSTTTGSLVNLASTSTAAGSNTQKVLNVTTSGANGTSTQTTYGGYFSNTHTGTSAKNVGLFATSSGGTTNNAIETLGSVYVETGNLTVNTASGVNSLLVGGSAHIQMGSQFGTGIFLRNSADSPTYQTATSATLSGYSMNTNVPAVRITSHLAGGATSGNMTLLALQNKNTTSLFNWASGTAIGRVLAIDPTYNITGGTTTVYGIDYNPTLTSMTGVTHVALRATEGQVVLGATGTSSANDRVKINGIGTTTGKGLVVNNSSGSERFSVQDDGVINFSGSGGTAGQVLESNGTSAPAWTNSKVSVTGSNQLYQVQVINISSGLVASGTGFAGINASGYANKSVLSVDFVIVMIKNDGTAVVYGKLTSIFRKNNSGTWTADVPGTATISDPTQLSGFVGDINGGVPGITWTTPGTTSGTWQLGYTAAISSTTN
jgi:hypothetical protein